MSAEMLSVVLWIPFGIVALIAGLIYCVSGYKRGLWRALGSLGSVALSTVVSVLLSRTLAGMISPGLTGTIPVDSGTELESTALQMLLASLLGVVLAMVLFGVLMLVLTPVFGKFIGKLLGNRRTEDSGSLKRAGMVTGLITAVMFALFFLAPVYGTLATAVPVVQSVNAVQQTQEQDMALMDGYADSISRHFLVQVSGTGPVGAVYDGITKVSVGDGAVSVVDMTKAINEAIELIAQAGKTEDPETATQISEDLTDLTRKNFIDQDWFYDLSQQLLVMAGTSAAESQTEDAIYTGKMLELAIMPKEEFQDVMGVLLDFIKYALGKGVLTISEDSDPVTLMESGIFQEMGKALNSSSRMVEFKKLLMAMTLKETGMTYQESMALLEKFQVGQLTDPQEQMLEAEALMLPGLSKSIPPVMMILRHPSLGEAALEEVEKTVSFSALMGYPGGEEDLKLSAKEQQVLMIALKKAAKLSFAEVAQTDTGLGNLIPSVVSADVAMPN